MRSRLTVGAGARRRRGIKARQNPSFERLESRLVLSADPFISEFLAVNTKTLADQNGDYSDWIEVHNPTTADINLDSWYLTDDPAVPAKWRFPAVNLPVGGNLVVFASGKNRAEGGSELHTNFKLDGQGEYLALVRPDGATVVSQYNPSFPEQYADVSYGLVRDSVVTTLLSAAAPVTTFVPPNDDLGLSWTTADFVPGPAWSGATTGVGFETQTGYESLIGTDVEAAMYNRSTSIYMRVPFQVSDPAWFDFLTLKMKYDDGFVAYLNGQLIGSRYAPSPEQWNSKATASHPDSAAVVYEVLDVTKYRGALRPGTNVLAVEGLNFAAADADFLIVPELVGGHETGRRERYFATPTPGSTNRGDVAGVVGDLAFSQTRGFFDAPFSLSITTSTPGAVIRYTTDGTAPTGTNFMTYAAPLSITRTTTLRAAAFKADYRSTAIETQTYIFLDDVIRQTKPTDPRYPTIWSGYAADYNMDPDVVTSSLYNKTIKDDLKAIPTLSIVLNPDDMFGTTSGIYTNSMQEGPAWERAASTELIYPDGTPGFQINNGIRIQGGYGRRPEQTGKHSFRLFFKDEYGPTKLAYPFFGSDAVGEFDSIILRAGFNYAWASNGGSNAQYIQDQFARDTLLAMGQYQAHGSYVHLYLNGLYWGLYNSVERPDASFAAAYVGGQKEDYDLLVTGQVSDGNRTAWNTMINMASAGLSTPTQYNAIQQYLDVPNLIDYLIVNIYGGNWDWPHNNWYASRSRTPDGRFRFYSWDAEGTLYDITADNSNVNAADSPGALYAALRGNAEFRLLFADRLQKYFFNNGVLTPQAAADRFMARARQIDRAVVGESARWGDYRREPPYTRDGDWLTFQNWLRTSFFPQRSAIVLNQFRANGLYPNVGAPSFNAAGGTVPEGFGLTMAGPGAVYYTDDGRDPRLTGGVISPSAKLYTGPITVLEDKHIMARALSGSTWSALNEAYFMVEIPPDLRISEVMYQPVAPPAGGPYTADDFEYIELANVGDEPYDLAGLHFSRGITFDFSTSGLTYVQPGQYVLVVKNRAAFASRYDTTNLVIAGEFGDTLSDAGELVQLDDTLGNPIAQFTYGSGGLWPLRAGGLGSSLEVIDPTINPAVVDGDLNTASHWRASSEYSGSPGAPGMGPYSGVVFNEVLAHGGASQRPAIELHNTTQAAIDISGWYMSDAIADYQKFPVLLGTILPGNGYVTFDDSQFHPSAGGGFALNAAHGGELHLLTAPSSGAPARFVDQITYRPMAEGESFGRYPDGSGEMVPMHAATFGAANSTPRVGPVVFSEIMYRPPEARPGVEDTVNEFVTLTNITSAPLALSEWFDKNQNGRQDVGEVFPWKLDSGVSYSFPAGTVLPAFDSLMVVGFDPVAQPETLAAFRRQYGLAASVPVVGPWTDKLDDGGETIRLVRPDTPPADEPSYVPYLLVEQVHYDDGTPWPTSPSGGGPWLIRQSLMAYGNDPANWGASSCFIVDNRDPRFTTVGLWGESGAVDEIAKSSYFSLESGASATWTPGFSGAGRYQVSVWWSRLLSNGTPYNRDPAAAYTISHSGGTTTLTFDQNLNYGQWVNLGTYDFPAGTGGSVRLTRSQIASDVQSTSADAVRFIGIYRLMPRVAGAVVNDGAAQRDRITSVAIQFLGDVSASLGSGDLTLQNDTTGAAVGLSSVTPIYNAATSTATWNLAGIPLEDGYYTATLSASGVTDAGGNPLVDGNYTLRFFRLGGDTDGNGSVDIFDVAALQVNYGQSSGMTPAQGDLDGDGDCDIFDVARLQTNFGKTLSPSAPGGMSPAPEPDQSAGAWGSVLAETPAGMRETPAPVPRGSFFAAMGVGGQTARSSDGSRGIRQLARHEMERIESPGPATWNPVRNRAGLARFPRRVVTHSAFASAVDEVIESRQAAPAVWDELVDAVAVAIHGQA